ncbi:MAG: 2-succinyl-6-hydroxy-2,4-cyclohexadiene-1-carboxylate synthase [Caldilineaceae bacterium]|nr:2-succinyl-6-hydroxy-2,4-cyclohexadiene-1-carboxylate synthase [Caldilineaceae bacterium]
MPTITVNGVKYFYTNRDAPPTSGQAASTLVLLHGFTGSSESWADHLPLFATAYRTIAIDLLGHGQTDAPAEPARYSMAASADDLMAILTLVAPGPIHLLGYSMGGRLALYLALTYPERIRSLILESASPGLADPVAQQERIRGDEALATAIETQGMAAFVERWEALPLFATQRALPVTIQQRLHDQRLCNQPQGLANSLRGMGTGVQPSLWSQLATAPMPTLLLAGALDLKFKAIATQMAQRLPHATVAIVPEAGHTLHLEQPQAFQAQVLRFLHATARTDAVATSYPYRI